MNRMLAACPCLAILTVVAAAQGADDKPRDPLGLVARAEKLCAEPDKEEAVLMLWAAIEQLAAQPEQPARTAAMQTAKSLLEKNDPLHAERMTAFTAIAKMQVELAAMYRARKWFDIAAGRLDVADRYDRGAAARERVLLGAARKAGDGRPAAPGAAPKGNPFFRRDATALINGPWKEGEDLLECGPNTKDHTSHEWILKATHEDCELSFELRGGNLQAGHDGALRFGIADGALCYQVTLAHYLEYERNYTLTVFEEDANGFKSLGHAFYTLTDPADGFHRVSVRIHGKSVRAQVDAEHPLEVATRVVPRGQFGLIVGITNQDSPGAAFRNLRLGPLPADAPSDEELRATTQAAAQGRVVNAVDGAKAALAKRQPEVAAMLLRQAAVDVRNLSAGLLRDNLAKSIESMLASTDAQWPRNKKLGQDAAKSLVAIADRYAAAGQVRAALRLVESAAEFDADGCAALLQAARDAANSRHQQLAEARAAVLAPPADDGTVLREWFGKGERFFAIGENWAVEGPSAQTVLAAGHFSAWMPREGVGPLMTARVAVHLPTAGTNAGFCCEALSTRDYAVVRLVRHPGELELEAVRFVKDRWQQVLSTKTALDAWQLDGWFEIAIERNAKGLIARCNGLTLELDHALVPATSGNFGLFAGNTTKTPIRMEFRAFRAGP